MRRRPRRSAPRVRTAQRRIPLLVAGLALLALNPLRAQEDADAPSASKPAKGTLVVVVQDRVLVQRGFVPVGDSRHLYGCAVGFPGGWNFAYDTATGSLAAVWKGPYIDTYEMWDGRSFNQLARPLGPVLALGGHPTVALFPDRLLEFPRAWPDRADPLYSPGGYERERDGTPVFLGTLADLTIRDRVAPTSDGRGLARSLRFGGQLSLWHTWILLAEGPTIEADGTGYRVGGIHLRVEVPAHSAFKPVIRSSDGRQQLVVRLLKENLSQPLDYTLLW